MNLRPNFMHEIKFNLKKFSAKTLHNSGCIPGMPTIEISMRLVSFE